MESKLSDKYRNEISWNGYGSDVMKSALQKYIRRGMPEKALYVAGELDLFKEAPDRGETIRTNFLHRLMIIFLEDVENTSLLPEIHSLITKLFLERNNPERNKVLEEQWISRIVFLLTNSTKARVCSHIRAVFNDKYKPLLDEYPTLKTLNTTISKGDKYELLYHALRSKSLNAIYYAFQIDAASELVDRKRPVWVIFDQLKKFYPEMDIYIDWYKNHLGKMKEGFLCWLFPMLVYLGVIPSEQPFDEQKIDAQGYAWDRNRRGETIEIDSFVVDRHTKKGKDKDLVEFAIVGAHVENEASFVNQLWKRFYEDSKRYEEGQPVLGEPIERVPASAERALRETEVFEFVVRTQITTSSSKMDVYFARDSTGKLVVVKGPYDNKKDLKVLLRNTKWKQRHNLPYIPFVIKQLIPDRWPEGIPLGARNAVDRTGPAWFIVFDAVVQDLVTKKHSSKLWPETEVVDWDAVSLHFDIKDRLTDREMEDYALALMFRYVRGVSDLADRNFLRAGGRVISIDEDIEKRHVNLYGELRKNKAAIMYKWFETHYDDLDAIEWESEDEEEKQRLKIVKNREKFLQLLKGN
jgi:hypothetical protein